jgi:hypothetical protein
LHKKQLRLVDLLRSSQEKVVLPGKFDWGIKVTYPTTKKLRKVLTQHCAGHLKAHQIDMLCRHVDDGKGFLDFAKLVSISKTCRARNRLQDQQARAASVMRSDPTSDLLHCNSSTVYSHVTSKYGNDQDFANQFDARNPGELNVSWAGEEDGGLGSLLPALQILHNALKHKRLDLGVVCGLKDRMWQDAWEQRGMKNSTVCKQYGKQHGVRSGGRRNREYGEMGQTSATAWRANQSFTGGGVSTEQVEGKQRRQFVPVNSFVRAVGVLKIGLSARTVMDIAEYFASSSGQVDVHAVHRSMSQLKQITTNQAKRRVMKRQKQRAAQPKQSATHLPCYRGDAVASLRPGQHSVAWGGADAWGDTSRSTSAPSFA